MKDPLMTDPKNKNKPMPFEMKKWLMEDLRL